MGDNSAAGRQVGWRQPSDSPGLDAVELDPLPPYTTPPPNFTQPGLQIVKTNLQSRSYQLVYQPFVVGGHNTASEAAELPPLPPYTAPLPNFTQPGLQIVKTNLKSRPYDIRYQPTEPVDILALRQWNRVYLAQIKAHDARYNADAERWLVRMRQRWEGRTELETEGCDFAYRCLVMVVIAVVVVVVLADLWRYYGLENRNGGSVC